MKDERGNVAVMPRPDELYMERHYTVGQLAEMWNFDESTIRGWFIDEPGVLKHGRASITGRKRPYVTLRIPESVARRVHAERSKGWLEAEAGRKRAAAERPPSAGTRRQRNSA